MAMPTAHFCSANEARSSSRNVNWGRYAKNLLEKEQEAKRWQEKAQAARRQWTGAGLAVETRAAYGPSPQERRFKTPRAGRGRGNGLCCTHLVDRSANAEMSYWVSNFISSSGHPLFGDAFLPRTTPAALGSLPRWQK